MKDGIGFSEGTMLMAVCVNFTATRVEISSRLLSLLNNGVVQDWDKTAITRHITKTRSFKWYSIIGYFKEKKCSIYLIEITRYKLDY